MRKQNENHQCKFEIKMTHNIRNMITHTEQSVMKMIALLIYWKKKKNISWKHLKNIKRKKKQDEQFKTLKKQKYLIK